MALHWTDDRNACPAQEVASGGEWRDGVYIPSANADARKPRNSLLHDMVRTLLELRAS